MSNHSGDANKMVDTPRTDAAYFKAGVTMYDMAGEMKRMERELAAAKQRIKRLEQAGDEMFKWSERVGQEYWMKAKEAKP